MILIAAHDQHHIIGYDGEIPWKISEDLRRFRDLTTGHIVIMGRKTFQSISKPLNNRINIVITREPEKLYPFKNVIYISLEELDETLKDLYQMEEHKNKKTFVIGGSEIYNELINECDTMYITEVNRPYNNKKLLDPSKYTYFKYDMNDWIQINSSNHYVCSNEPELMFSYVDYVRKNKNTK